MLQESLAGKLGWNLRKNFADRDKEHAKRLCAKLAEICGMIVTADALVNGGYTVDGITFTLADGHHLLASDGKYSITVATPKQLSDWLRNKK